MRTLFNAAAALLAQMAQAIPVVRTGPEIKCIVHEFSKRPHAKVLGGVCTAGVAILALMFSTLMAAPEVAMGLLMAFPAVATTRDLKSILKEMKEIQDEYRGKAMPTDVGEKFETLAKEAKEIQDEVDRDNTIKAAERFSREVPDPTMPDDEPAQKRESDVVGYLSVGSAFVQSEEFKRYLESGMPKSNSQPLTVKSARGGRERFVPLTRKALDKLNESKAVAALGADVIEPQRLSEVVRDEEMELLTMRDLLNVSPTNSNAIQYVTFTPNPAGPQAAPTAESGLKPETTFSLGTATAPVRTIPVHMPVTEQQLQDFPQIRNMIDTELRYEIAFVEDEQLAWGDGTGENLLGIFNTPGVLEGRAVTGDTLLDRVRRAMTDVRVTRNLPNGLAVHPYDMEAIQLLKGTDDRYVWIVVTDPATGQMRLWGLQAVESLGMERPDLATGTNTIHERRILIGDFVRGATLWDRQQTTVSVGWVNDQFIRNQRTILAEERVAFGVKRPQAFRYIVAQAEAA